MSDDTDTLHARVPGRAPERDNENALRKYPFADAATCRNDACILPSGALVDAQIMLFGDAQTAWLSKIDADGRIHVSTDAGAFASSDDPISPGATVVLHTVDDGAETYAGVVVCGGVDPVSALLACGEQAFARAGTTFAEDAVTRFGIPSVTGFRLDDGNVVCGDVRFVGTGGCDVATFATHDGRRCLMVSVIGESAESACNECVSGIRLLNDNVAFTAYVHPLSPFTILLSLRGARMSDGTSSESFLDQNTICAHVQKSNRSSPRALGSVIAGISGPDAPEEPEDPGDAGDDGSDPADPSDLTNPPVAEDPPGAAPNVGTYLFCTHVPTDGAWTLRYDTTRTYSVGDLLVSADTGPIPVPPNLDYDGYEYRFTGYYTAPDEMVTGSPETGERVIDATGRAAVAGATAVAGSVMLYAHWLAIPKPTTISFLPEANPTGYGTLHVVADSTTGYDSPVKIVGIQASLKTEPPTHNAGILTDGGAQLSDRVINPPTTAGGIEISIRGIDKLNLL